jgi:acyl-CoA reductase-like NAD-dependent aldehyde dehydrogenase
MSARETAIREALPAEVPGAPRARMMLQRARWAATAFATYDRDRTRRIVETVVDVAYQNSERFAHEAVAETGMGVAEHKRRKNEACSRGLLERNAAEDFVGIRIDAVRKLLEVPKPAGVILALTPSTDPIATTYSKVLCALMTRNAIVVAPHPMARRVCTEAVRLLARAAVAAGAPDGCLQVVQEPTAPLIESLMTDPETDLILATGGTALVRAAYRSGNPALGAGPGNVPAMVDATADIARAAACLVDSTSFDNSLLSTCESMLIAEESIADGLLAELGRHGACVLDAEATSRIRANCYPDGRIDTALAGKGAIELAQAAGISVPAGTRVLVAPFALIVPEEPLAQEKLFPLLGFARVPSAQLGIEAARALLRIGGAGHSAVIHSRNPATILAYGAALRALRISVNAPGSTGSAGLDTNLAPTMTIGTGFFGRSALTGNLQPRDLVQWTQVAYASDPSEALGDFTGLQPWTSTAALATTRIESDAVPLVPAPPVAAVLRPSTWSAPALPGEVVGDSEAVPAAAGPGAA